MNLADQELDQVGKAPERIQLEENTALPMTEKTINLESDDEVCAENNSCEDNKGKEGKRNAGSIFMLRKIRVILLSSSLIFYYQVILYY